VPEDSFHVEYTSGRGECEYDTWQNSRASFLFHVLCKFSFVCFVSKDRHVGIPNAKGWDWQANFAIDGETLTREYVFEAKPFNRRRDYRVERIDRSVAFGLRSHDGHRGGTQGSD
jgi:hypothetical protein